MKCPLHSHVHINVTHKCHYEPLPRPTQNSSMNDRFDRVLTDVWLSPLFRRLLAFLRLRFVSNETLLWPNNSWNFGNSHTND